MEEKSIPLLCRVLHRVCRHESARADAAALSRRDGHGGRGGDHALVRHDIRREFHIARHRRADMGSSVRQIRAKTDGAACELLAWRHHGRLRPRDESRATFRAAAHAGRDERISRRGRAARRAGGAEGKVGLGARHLLHVSSLGRAARSAFRRLARRAHGMPRRVLLRRRLLLRRLRLNVLRSRIIHARAPRRGRLVLEDVQNDSSSAPRRWHFHDDVSSSLLTHVRPPHHHRLHRVARARV